MTNVPVTDADREYADRWAKGLSDAERDALANAHAAGRAEGAASEREACELALALVERPKKFRADPIRRDTFDDTVAACMDAIRARGEGGKA